MATDPAPSGERISKCVMRTGDVDGLNYPCGVAGCPEPGHDEPAPLSPDVGELVRRVREEYCSSSLADELADVCERQAKRIEELESGLRDAYKWFDGNVSMAQCSPEEPPEPADAFSYECSEQCRWISVLLAESEAKG